MGLLWNSHKNSVLKVAFKGLLAKAERDETVAKRSLCLNLLIKYAIKA